MVELPGPNETPVPLGALGKEIVKVIERPQLIALAIGVVVGLAGPLAVLNAVPGAARTDEESLVWLWLAAAVSIGSLALGGAIVAFLPMVMIGSRDRAASAVHAWIGAREVRRLLGSTTAAVNIPTTPEEAQAWLAAHADEPRLRPLRLEMLVFARRFHEARMTIERLPRKSPLDEYRVVEAEALVADQEGGPVDLIALRQAARRVPAGIDRTEALASLAILEARRMIGKGDWRAPLLAARTEIGGSDWAILGRDLAWPVFLIVARRIVLPMAIFVVLVALAVSVMAII